MASYLMPISNERASNWMRRGEDGRFGSSSNDKKIRKTEHQSKGLKNNSIPS